ncbi:MAG TPA: GWxTD domain-containing protein [Anaerolineales bacterium]
MPTRNWLLIAGFSLGLPLVLAWSQDKPLDQPAPGAPASVSSQSSPEQAADPLKRPLSEKEKKERAKALKKELSHTYKKWLDEDVQYIISDQEKAAFLQLSNDEERDNFIEQFWQRRNPDPDSQENVYKEEHYRRIAYANEHFAAGIPGWRTDRGRMYIMHGPPDQIDAHPSGGTYERPTEEGGGTTSTYPFEDWRYRNIDGIGQEVIIEFVDSCMCGNYHMTMDRGEKDALLHTPGAGLTQYEQMGMSSKAARLGGMETLGAGPYSAMNQTKQFDRLEQYAKLNAPPPVKFKDLEEVVTHKISMNLMPFDVHMDFVKLTSDTVLVPVTLQMKNRNLTFNNKDGVQRGVVNIFGRVTSIGGRVVQTFEDTVQVDVPAELLEKSLDHASIYWKALPLRSGRYRVDLVVKDVNGDRVGTWSKGIQVPEYEEEKLATSSLILADDMEKVAAKNVGAGQFVIGTTKVRPKVESADGKPASFKRNQKIGFWMQVYNLGVDKKTNRPEASVEYDVINAASQKQVLSAVESTNTMGNVGDQLTLEKMMSLASLEPGIYQVTIKVDDKLSKQTIAPTARFRVE